MFICLTNGAHRPNLVARFTIISLLLMILGMVGIGWWVGEQIKNGVIKESAVTTALYVDSFISPNLQELSRTNKLSTQKFSVLNSLLRDTDLGDHIVVFKVWDRQGDVVYSKGPTLYSDIFPNEIDQARVWQGEVVGIISASTAEKNLEQQKFNSRLLQIYSPVRLSGSNQVIAVAEFYIKVDALQAEIDTAQQHGWFVVGITMTLIYFLLVGFVRWAGNTIGRQQTELTQQVTRLTELLAQNEDLHRRVQRAAANATALNENFLRRISADLHDGPTQELGAALLRLDRVIGQNETSRLHNVNFQCDEQLPIIQTSLQMALQEMRAIAAGFGLPHLESLTLAELLKRVVRSHEQRTGTKVAMQHEQLPQQTDLPIKIALYRLIQEALNNAHRHAGGADQKVWIKNETNILLVEVSDRGPGFDINQPIDWSEHLGLSGMRERVESLGGLFKIESETGRGTKVIARLPLHTTGEFLYG